MILKSSSFCEHIGREAVEIKLNWSALSQDGSLQLSPVWLPAIELIAQEKKIGGMCLANTISVS